MNDRRRREEDFVRDVLARTSGSACRRARDLLPGLAEHRLDDLDRQLVQAHLEHCADCRAVAVTLGWLEPLLPRMAVMDPGPGFTAAVIGRTTGVLTPLEKAARAGLATGPAGLMDRLGSWWQRQVLKPRFALQFAYVATVILVLLTALPVSPLKEAPARAWQVLQAGPAGIPVFGSARLWVDRRSEIFLDGLRQEIGSRERNLADGLARRRERSEAARKQVSRHLETALAMVRQQEWGQAGGEMIRAGRSSRRAWNDWWSDERSRENHEPRKRTENP